MAQTSVKAFLALILLSHGSLAYVFSKTEHGEKIRWSASETLPLYIDARDENSYGVEPQDVKDAIEKTISDFNKTSPVKFSSVYTQTLPPAGTKATFRFSSSPAYFGSGVLAVTSVSYNNSTGVIYGADILMNDTGLASSVFTSDPSYSSGPYAYLGDVMAHEFGHLLGLNHSETLGSTMVYSIFKGQHSPASDDQLGIADLYDLASKGSVSGKVAGENSVPVFGAHVQAIDLETNEIAAGVFTNSLGEFKIKGLDPKGSYVLYIAPIRSKEDLTKRFSSFRSDFCDGESFQPSFYSKCGGSSAGRAQVVTPNISLDVGTLTVKCATSVDPKYLKTKANGFEDRFLVWDYYEKYKLHETFTGYFSKDEINDGFSGNGDRFKIDLSGVAAASGSTYVELSFSTEKLGTAIGLGVYAKRADQSSFQFYSFNYDPYTNKPELDFKMALPLSLDADDNIFELDIYPVSLNSGEKTSIFASPKTMTNARDFYFISAVLKDDAGPVAGWNDFPYEDNAACLEGNPVTATEAYEPATKSSGVGGQDESFSCATVSDIGGGSGPGGGPMSFLIGAALALLLFAPRKKRPDFFV